MRRLFFSALTLAAVLLGCASASAAAPTAKLSSRLRQIVKPSLVGKTPTAQSDAVDLAPTGPASLARSGGKLLVEVRFGDDPAAAGAALKAAGATVVNVSDKYATTTAAVPAEDVKAVAAVPGVRSVTEVLSPQTSAPAHTNTWSPQTCLGATTSQGVAQLKVDQARANYAAIGSGVKVGVLSDSFDTSGSLAATRDRAAHDTATGDLPGAGDPCGFATPTKVLADYTGPDATDEGRAMTKIVHDVAPGAALDFATADLGELDFADEIHALADDGAKVIVDDVTYYDEPMFQDGPVANAVNSVTSGADPVSYFSSAGNENSKQGNDDIGSFETPHYRATACPTTPQDEAHPDAVPSDGDCENFAPSGAADDELELGTDAAHDLSLDFQWSEPWNGVTNDFDLYVLDDNDQVVASSTDDNLTTQRPFEFLSLPDDGDTSYHVVIHRKAGSTGTPRMKFVTFGQGLTSQERPTGGGGDVVGPSIFSHNGAANAVTLAAVDAGDDDALETYSSRGPVTHYWEPVDDGGTAASPQAAQVLAKPDLAASDCTSDTFFGGGEFCGTSAAAPHAAGVAALAYGAKPSATPAQVLSAMKATARPIGSFGPTAVGAGLIDADAILGALGVAPMTGDSTTPILSQSGSLLSSDAPQTGRIDRGTRGESPPTACSDPAPAPGLISTNPFVHDVYSRRNITDDPQCVRVTVTPGTGCTASPAGLQSNGYLGAIDATDPRKNLAAVAGFPLSTAAATYFVAVPAGQRLYMDVNATSSTGCPAYAIRADSDKPFAFTLPAVTGPSASGVVSTTTGVWSGAPAFAYRWQRCDSAGADCVAIPGTAAAGASYTKTAADTGRRLRVEVTATRFGKVATATSAAPGALVPGTPATPPPARTTPTSPVKPVAPAKDRTAPNTTIASGPPARTSKPAASFTFGATEAGATFRCRIDKRALTACSSGKAYKGLAAGKHTFKVAATDKAGNVDLTSASWTFTVVAPQTKIKKGPKAKTTSRTAAFRIASTQGKSSFRCRLDKGKVRRCSSPKTFKHLGRGRHTFRVYAVNRYGLRDKTSAQRVWKIT